VADPDPVPGPVVVALPAEIDMTNTDCVGELSRPGFVGGYDALASGMIIV
jgi:hypothetical protein